jgi:glycyl-tRNA synthetase
MTDNLAGSNPQAPHSSNLKKDLKVISDFCKRKGFVYQGSEIYGGLANTWDFGPKGLLLLNNIKNAWREFFIRQRMDIVEIETGILMNSRVWEASGHLAGFSDCMVDDKITKHRFRADHLIEDQLNIDVEGKTAEEITQIIRDNKLINPHTGKPGEWTEARYMNLMFETNRDKIGNDPNQKLYLRPETAQGMFVQFKNVQQSERMKLPFGIAQVGKAFRNEITPGNFIFRVVEFEQMEIEYFIKPPRNDEQWNQKFEELLEAQRAFVTEGLGVKSENIRFKEHSKEKLSHYSKRTVDIEYNYPFGWSEWTGNAYRTDFDLAQHQQHSGQDLTYFDPENNQKYLPHVIEPTVGVGRSLLAILCDAYTEEQLEGGDSRVVMKFKPEIAPYKFAVLPLMKKDGLADKARELLLKLRKAGISCDYDEAGSIGKRYRRQDENGTPKCICVDYQTLEDGTFTIRDRDTMEQERVTLEQII